MNLKAFENKVKKESITAKKNGQACYLVVTNFPPGKFVYYIQQGLDTVEIEQSRVEEVLAILDDEGYMLMYKLTNGGTFFENQLYKTYTEASTHIRD